MTIGRLGRAALLFIAGIAAGGMLALALRGGEAQNDPCFGHGDLIATRTYTVSSDGAANARELGIRAASGDRREARECRASPLDVLTVDGATGRVLASEISFADALAYYAQHPEEAPVARAEQAAKQGFAAVDRTAVRPLVSTSGCAPSWRRLDVGARDLRLCYPRGWKVDPSATGRVLLSTPPITLNVHSPSTTAALECEQPETFDSPTGVVEVCAMPPLEGGQSHHLLLPNRIVAYLWVADAATTAERATAFRVAMSLEALP